MKVADLKKILKDRGEKVGGKKEELVERILNPTPQAAAPQVGGVTTLPPVPEGFPPLVLPGVDEDEDEATVEEDEDEEVAGAPVLPLVPGALPLVPTFPQSGSPVLPLVPALPQATSPALPVVVSPALPTVPGLPMATSPRLPVVPTLPTVPGLPRATSPALPTLPGLPQVGSPQI